ncbi:MAG: glycosyltransferase [Hyphomicrobiales bacterium]|nr:glycosyltransferase [Hyphomicrobiales bacterium]
MSTDPLVSVIMSVYNGDAFVEEAANSILEQTYKNIEFIIFDDGSSDACPKILQRLAKSDNRIRLTIQQNCGIPVTANRMIEQSRGTYISLMDHDDIKLPDCIARQVDYLQRNPKCVAVGALSVTINERGETLRRRNKLSYKLRPYSIRRPNFLTFPPEIPSITNPSALIRSEAMRQVGGYRENFIYAHDFDLWFRLSELGEIHQINDELILYRIHGKNTTSTKRLDIIRHEIVVVLSALSRHNHLDDSAIINKFLGSVNFEETITHYRELLGATFPIDTYLFFKAVGARLPELVNERDTLALRRRIFEHIARGAPSFPKLKLARRLLSRTLRKP